MAPKGTPSTKKVRVLVREVGYLGYENDQVGNLIMRPMRGYGPGQPQLEPSVRLGDDVDTSSKKYKDAVDEYQHGQVIELLADDYNRHKKFGVVVDLGDEPPVEPGDSEDYLDVANASVEQLTEWIEEEKPTVQEVVNASGGDPDIAHRLLEAESRAQDGEPRKGVLDGLSHVIGQT